MSEPIAIPVRPKIIIPVLLHGRRSRHISALINSIGWHYTHYQNELDHDIEVVVYDGTHNPAIRQRNEETIRALRKTFRGMPIHYYPPEQLGFVDTAIKNVHGRLDQAEARYAYSNLVHPYGHRGSERNALLLCAVREGKRNGVYVHFDDHTGLPTGRNEFQLILNQVTQLTPKQVGYQALVVRPENPHAHDYETVTSGRHPRETSGMSGRVYLYPALTKPFPPFGRDTSETHRIQLEIADAPRTPSADHALVIATRKPNEEHLEGAEPRRESIPAEIRDANGWKILVNNVANLD